MNRRYFSVFLSLVLFLLSPAYTQAKKVSKDKTPPTVTLAMPAPTGKNGWYNQPIFISVQASDPGGVKSKKISLGGTTWYENALMVRTDGTFMVIGKATDRAGNTASVREIIHVDLTAPTVTFDVPEANGNADWYLNPARIFLAGEDALSGVYQTELIAQSSYEPTERSLLDIQEMYRPLNDQENSEHIILGNSFSESQATIELHQSGMYQVSGYVEDIAGNRTFVETEILMDLDAPQISYQTPKNYFREITLSGALADHDSGISQVWLNNGSGWQQIEFDQAVWTSSWNTVDLKDGEHVIKAMVSDKAGNLTKINYPVTVVNNIWVIFALCGILLSLGLVALYDPRRKAIQEFSMTLARYAHMEHNARHLRKEF